ncbi:ABC transporter permease subunit [Paenibacillus sp. HB172176]|uniref:ABC transporter permease n=1 Tax=Paenibacillus sp. HB172176 TaxID=2493690 RepID=UPI00143B6162|nr:ABC transporter permease subunit [Paenibacillus sp. HB172176]
MYMFMLPAVSYYVIFHYLPMYGLQIAFKDFKVTKGIWGSSWVGFAHIERFVNSFYFWDLLRNTLLINVYQLMLFPVSIIVALSFNELKDGLYKRSVQTITYAPHFISVVVMSGMIIAFLNPSTGIVNTVIKAFGGKAIAFMTDPAWFKSIFVLSGEWQQLGWGAIIYLAALSGVDPQLHEAARVDGANRLRRIWHINLPHIAPTITILLILNFGSFMAIGFEKIYLLQNDLNLASSDVIQTYVYRSGLLNAQYSFSSAVGFFNSIINFILLIVFNRIAKKTTETSLW